MKFYLIISLHLTVKAGTCCPTGLLLIIVFQNATNIYEEGLPTHTSASAHSL